MNNAELSIGCRNGSTPANFISGDFGETAFFNRNINVKEKAEIEEYLYKKWKMKKFEGTLPAVTTPASANTCSVSSGTGYSAKTLLPVGSASFPCDEGYTGTINYDCPSSGGTATKTGGSCTASPIKCYAIDRVGLRGTNYFLNASDGDGQYQNIEVWSDVFRIYSDVTNTPLVNRIKLLDVYHGPLIYQSTQSSYIFDFNPIDTSKFSTTSYPSLITYETLFFPYEFWYVSGTNTFTKYARILDYGTNTFTCDSGFTGTLTYNCTVDGSTLNPSSGSCTAN